MDGGIFGRWENDKFGLPSYILNNEVVSQKNQSVWHQIGNHRITATFHPEGFLQFYSSDRGLVCITPYQPLLNLYGGFLVGLRFRDGREILLKNGEFCKEVRFGIGYGRILYKIENIDIDINHWTPEGDFPLIITDIVLTNIKNSLLKNIFILFSVGYYFIDFDPIYTGRRRVDFGGGILGQFLSFISKNILYPLRLNTEFRRSRFAKQFKYATEKSGDIVFVHPVRYAQLSFNEEIPVSYPTCPFSFFVKSEDANINILDSRLAFNKAGNFLGTDKKSFQNKFSHPVVVNCLYDISHKKNREKLRLIWGYEDKKCAIGWIEKSKGQNLETNIKKKHFLIFNLENLPDVKRELTWHSYYLQSSSMYDNYFKSHNVRQGSAYYFLQGLDGAVRDFAFFAVPLCYLNPYLAKEILITILEMTYKDGRLPYAIYGYGKVSGFGMYSFPTDIYLSFLWALTEYLYATRDFSFLEEKYPFYPLSKREYRSVYQQLLITCNYIMNNIGIGPHNLIRVGTGDWNDPISLHTRDRSAFVKKGESTYNTAFALYVLPKVVPLLSMYEKKVGYLLEKFIKKITDGLNKQWTGRWLLRGWDGAGNPIGENHLYLEHHVWALISDILTKKQKIQIVKSIYNLLDKKSPFGVNILHPPKKIKFDLIPKGWDTNGGIWSIMNSLLSWGYGKVDKNLAKAAFLKSTLFSHARVYPHIWYGIFSGPDAYNAHYTKDAGKTYCHFTPTSDYPIMNANSHCAPLLSAIKLCGVEPTFTGIHISSHLPDEKFYISTPLISLTKNSCSLLINYHPLSYKKEILFTVEEKNWKDKKITVQANNRNILFQKDSQKIKISIPLQKEVKLLIQVKED